MKTRIARVAMLLIVAVTATAPAAPDVFTWEFESPTNYVYNPQLIEVSNSLARLVLQAEALRNARYEDYTNGATLSKLAFDESASVQLVNTAGSYASNGVFVSRIIAAPAGTQWQTLQIVGSHSDYRTDPSVKAYYKFDADAWLEQETRQVATVIGSPSFSTDRVLGSHSARFSQNNYLRSASSPLTSASALTVAVWVKLDTYTLFGGVYCGTAAGGTIRIRQRDPASRVMEARLVTTGGGLDVNVPISVSAWTHIAVTWNDSSLLDGRLRMYVNGTLGAVTATGVGGLMTLTSAPFIGNDFEQPTIRAMSGRLDDLLVLNRALVAEEVRQLYENQSPIFNPVRVRVRTGPDIPTLQSRSFVGSAASPDTSYTRGISTLTFGADVVNGDPLIQYEAVLLPDQLAQQTPFLRAVRFVGNISDVGDNTVTDFGQGSFMGTTVMVPDRDNSPYIGLAKRENGGYYTNGIYLSPVIDAGANVQWHQLMWAGPSPLPVEDPGLVAFWRCENNWQDSLGIFSVFNPANAAFSPFAKVGLASALFNGVDNSVSGFESLGAIQGVSFWIQNPNVNDEIMALNGALTVSISNRSVVVNGLISSERRIFVNGAEASARLFPGWNHVALNFALPQTVSSLVIGQIPGVGYMEGKLDEIAFYRRQLIEGEINAQYVRGERTVGGRVRFQVSDASLTNFVGVNGDPNQYFTAPPATDQAGNLLGAIGAQRYIRYKVFLDGEGDATPMVRWVRLSTSPPTSVQYYHQTASDFYEGERVEGRSQIYGGQLSLTDRVALGPQNLSPLSQGSVGIWHFDDDNWAGAGRVVRAAKGEDGVAVGAAETSFDARVGRKSGSFDGVTSYVDGMGIGVSLGVSDFSAALWFKTTSATVAPMFMLKDGTRYFALRMNTDGLAPVTGAVAFVVNDSAGERAVTSWRRGLNDGLWHHLVGVRNGEQLLLYVDGDRVGTLQVPGLGNCGLQITCIAATDPALATFYSGSLDELIVYQKALSEKEIGDLFAGGVSTETMGVYESQIYTRDEPSIWKTLEWVPRGPYSKPLTVQANDPALIGIWHLDEASGVVSNLVSVNGLHGTVVGAAYRAPGRFNYALDFDANAQQYVQVGHHALLEPSPESLTVEAWVQMDAVNDRAVISKRNGSHGYALSTDSEGRPTFWAGGASCRDRVALRVGKWTHLTGTFTGNRLRLYVDGMLVDSVVGGGGSLASGANLNFGRSHVPGSYFDGRMDAVAVHARALNAVEVADHYRAGAVTLKFQARSATNLPFATPYTGPGRTTNTYFVLSPGTEIAGDIDSGFHFQYRGFLETDDFRFPPELLGVSVYASGYPLSRPAIYPGVANLSYFPGNLVGFEHLRLQNPNTDVKYQISGDEGDIPRWFYWDDSAKVWREQDQLGPDIYTFQANSLAQVSTNIVSFYTQVYNKTGGVFRFRAFLSSTGVDQAGLDWVRLTSAPGRIVITDPDGDENGDRSWLVSVPYDITWDYTTNVTGTVRIQYTTDRVIWRDLAPAANAVPINDRRHTWITPATVTTQALVRIIHNTEPSINDVSDGTFTLAQGLQVAQHNGGSPTWYIGETNTIIWRRSFLASPAHLEFSATGAFAGEQVRLTSTPRGTDAINSYDWVIPMTNAGLVSETGYLRVIEQSARYADVSDAPFLLAGAVLTAPTPGQSVKKDAEFTLQWTSAGMGPLVSLELQSVPGGAWELIADSVPNVSGPNAYVWTPTNDPTENARIRILSPTDSRAQGLSEPFDIAAIELTTPLGNPDLSQSEIWLQNTTQTIAWISGGASTSVSVQYSTDSGANYTTIVSNYPNSNAFGFTNTYAWTVAPFPSETVRVRIQDEESPDDLFSTSRYDFQIAGLRVVWPNGPYPALPGLPAQWWDKGVQETILWDENAVGFDGVVEFSDDNGATWLTVAQGPLLGNLQQPYTPTNPTLRALVRITASDPVPFTNVFDRSDYSFAVAGIRVVSPGPSSEFTIGTTNQVRFVIAATRDLDGYAPITYAGDGISFDFGNPLNPPADIFIDGAVHTYNWVVEASRRPSPNARLQVQAGPLGTPYIGLSEPFTLRGISFDSPTRTSIWAPGVQNVQWAVAGIAADAQATLSLSLTGGSTGSYTNIIASGILASVGSYAWTIPDGLGPSTNARLRLAVTSSIQKPSDVGYQAFSEVFSLQGLRVYNPSVTSRWNMGSAQLIQWTAAAAGGFVDLFYSENGGTTYDPLAIRTFAPSANGTNSSPWTVEMSRTPSTNARVRAVSRTFPSIASQSDPFRVNGIRVTRPTATDIYASTDATNLISWVGVKDHPGGYDLYYIADGLPQQLIAAGVTSSPYNWDIPIGAISSDIRIRITDGIHANTSAVFRVVDQPTISIAEPDAGAFWEIGEIYPIIWNRGGQMPNEFNVFYSPAPFNVTNLISDGSDSIFDPTNNSFQIMWQVPDVPGAARITVVNTNPTRTFVRDTTDDFYFVGKYRILNPPGPNDLYALKQNTPIVWETRGSIAAVDLYYSLSPAHEASSWVKINNSPITNIFKPFNPGDPDGSWSRVSFPWTVVNARTAVAAVRVQEAAFPQLFEPQSGGPFADSDDFPIYYYTIYWNVFDQTTGQQLDHLSIVDSSGWGVSDASAIPPNVIQNDYPWGTFNTEIYREGFFDASILFWESENTDISVPGPRVWTQDVAMVRSLSVDSYHVMANFSYESLTTNFTINTWLERGGVILEDPNTSTVTIYDEQGTQIDQVFTNAPLPNGIFWLNWSAASLSPRSVYFAKVDIEYSGFKYSSGLTFTLLVPLSEEIGQAIENLSDSLTNAFNEGIGDILTNVAGLVSDVQDLSGVTQSGFSNLTELAMTTTGLLGRVTEDVSFLTNEVSVLAPKLDTLTNAITTIGLPGLARILSRPDAVAFGSTNTILYKTRSNYDPGTVQMQVKAPSGAVVDVVTLNEMPVPGLYDGGYIANWGLNTYQVTVIDPGASDSMMLRVIDGDPYAIPVLIGDVGSQLDAIETQLVHMALATDAITNDVLPRLEVVQQQLASLSTGDLSFIQFAVSSLTNQLATLEGLEEIGAQVAILTNSIAQISSVSNVADMVASLTNALTGVDWQDVRDIQTSINNLETNISSDFGDLMSLQSDVQLLTNAVLSSRGMAYNLQALTNKLMNVDFVDMNKSLTATTNILAGLDELGAISASIGQLSNSLNQIQALTNMAPIVTALGAELLPLDWAQFERDMQTTTNLLTSLDGLEEIADQIGGLSNALAAISGVTNLTGQMNDIWTELQLVDLARIDRDLQVVTNTMEALDGLQGIADSIAGLSNALDQVSGLTNLNGQVDDIWTELQLIDLFQLGSDVSRITNQMAGLRVDVGSIGGGLFAVSNIVNGAARDLTTVTNRLDAFDWNTMLAIQTQVDQVNSNILALGELDAIASDLQNLTNSIARLGGITNIGAQVADITNALQGLNWQDVLYIRGQVDIITNELTALDRLDELGVITESIDDLTNSIAQLGGVTNMSGQINAISGALLGVNFFALTNEVRTIRDVVGTFNWADINTMRQDLQTTTNILQGLVDLPDLVDNMQTLTNAFPDLSGVTNLTEQVNLIAGAVLAADLSAMERNIQITTNELARLGVQLEGVVAVTNVSAVVGQLTTNLSAVNWADIRSLQRDMTTVTNALTGLDSLEEMIEALNGLSNSIDAISGVTNIGADVSGLTALIGDLTNALVGIDWTDVEEIQANVNTLTNQLADFDTMLALLEGVTNAVGGIGDLGTLEAQMAQLTNQFAGADWSDIAQIQSDMGAVTNTLTELSALATLSGQIDELILSLDGVTNISGDVAALSAVFADADWGDVTTIQTTLNTLNDSLAGLDGVDLTAFDPDAVTRMESTLGAMATVNLVDEIERLMGQESDTAEADTVFGRMASMEQQLTVVGIDAKNAATRAQGAKTRAKDAVGGIDELRTAIEDGELLEAMAALRKIQEALRTAQEDLRLIPKDIDPSSTFATVRRMADVVNELATSKGFPALLNLEAPAAGAEGGGVDKQLATQLNEQIQEVRVSMDFVKELVDEMRFEPLVHESFLGVE